MTQAIALLLVFGGFTCLAAAMGKGRRPSVRRALRICGGVGLALALAACMHDEGPARGSILWTGLLSAGGLMVAMLRSVTTPTAGPRGK